MAEGEGNRPRATWSPAETRFLISLWAEDNIRERLESARNKYAYVQIQQALRDAGYVRTVDQVRRKIRDLKYAYNKTTDINKKSGRGRKTRPFFDEMNLFLGSREAAEPGSLLESQEHSGKS
ncbi:hypothetical protein Bbelb_317610 [Branchiostoma belcheri]|nr:hypothetical protein Bbelb_317610 [Branchiostoma belcheri]